MVTFDVNDMTCGHCVSAITKAVAFVDPGAKVQVDLVSHRVQIESTASTVAVLGDAIKTAGFTSVALAGGAAQSTQPALRRGCCCG